MATVVFPRRVVAVEPRGRPSLLVRVASPLIAVVGAGAVGALLLLATGHSPTEAYARIARASFGNRFGWVSTLISATPLILTSVAASVAFRMKVWNIGAEGQLILGAVAASGLALALGEAAPPILALTVVLLVGVVAGALWAALAAVPRAYLHTDEVITTLMLTFIAQHLIDYFIFGSVSFWRDTGSITFPKGRLIPEAAQLPTIWLRLHAGLLIAIGVAAFFWWLMRWSRWGFDVRVIGASPRTALYAGMSVARRTLSVLMISGAVAGLAGAIQVTGVTQALEPKSIAVGVGFTGILVAAVARFDFLAIVPVSILIAGLTNAGASLQILGIPADIVILLQGLALLLVAAGEFLLHNRVRIGLGRRQPVQEAT
jgi:general nucleoside transport system permease protein